MVSELLRDLLGNMAYHHAHVVLVIPQEPTLAWDALLCMQPSFAVTYLNGDLRCGLLLSSHRATEAAYRIRADGAHKRRRVCSHSLPQAK